jgi:GT2 family glycosyltransferase
MNISIIIINYNLAAEVKKCIDSLLDLKCCTEFEIILIDNHSEEESIITAIEKLKQNQKLDLTFIRTEKNIGFGNACNLAAKLAKGDLLFFLNPDTVIKKNIFDPVINYYKKNSADGIIGLNVSDKQFLDFSAGYFPNLIFETLNLILLGRCCEALYVKLYSILSKNKKLKVHWVMGAAFFIPRTLFESLNGFDSDYFLYFEELDLCKRVIRSGFSVNYLSNVKVDHSGSVSTKKNYYFFTKMFYKGKLLFLKKHCSNFGYQIYKALLFMHITNQSIFWRIMKFKNIQKSLGKIHAFNEILENMNHPENISNTP